MLRLLLAAVACVASLSAAEAAGMRFSVVRDCQVRCVEAVLAEGEITNTSYRWLAGTLRLAPGAPVLLHSPGGTTVGGMLLGLELRRLQANVIVPRGFECASACAYAFLGGVRREVRPGGKLGIHRGRLVSLSGRTPTESEKREGARLMRRVLREYTRILGVSPEIVAAAYRVDSADIRYLPQGEMRRMGVVNVGGKAAKRKAARTARR